MKAQYDLKPGIGPKNTENERTLYPQLITRGTKDLKDIMRHATTHSGLNGAVVQGVITYLETVLAGYLAEGYRVKLGNIGTFSATLTSRKVSTKKEIRSRSIHFNNVNFKAHKELKKNINQQMKLEKVETDRAFKASSNKYTEEERLQLLFDYLGKHSYITRAQYSELTGLLKTKAANELRKWYQGGIIDKEGRVPHIIYKKRES